ncbi:MAG TPA: hypothetical protein ENH13_03380 [Euryarchaeota archaeon]|nr:hypothetical protein BMS3Abin16_00524 [archaeon BMS3Abin16]GBE55897.1 hypothetical protein BMS3Bbin16_00092 [archaeon BMS3Bbin16]HDH28155.1 hypothetical protein [Euryarchaeota archaeon]
MPSYDSQIVSTSLKGGALSVLIIAVSFAFVEWVGLPPDFFSIISLVFFLFVGALEEKWTHESDSKSPFMDALVANLITPLWTALGVVLLVIFIHFLQGQIRDFTDLLDSLGFVTIVTVFWVVGAPVMAAVLFAGGWGYNLIQKYFQKKN